MYQPTQEDFDTARDVLEYMVASIQCHEPSAFNTINDMEAVLGSNSWTVEDYPEAD